MGEELREYSKLLERVLSRFPELSRGELEAMVEAKLRESPLLNRVGALLLVAEELGAFREEPKETAPPHAVQTYTKIMNLVPGLRDVSVRGVVYAITAPITARDHKLMRMKIGDDSGTIDVTLWNEKVDEVAAVELQVGDMVVILHAYTRERIETGTPELHVGRGGVVTKLEREPGAPDPRSFYIDLGDALDSGDGIYDIKAMVLDLGEERRIDTRYGEAVVRDIRLIGETGEARLTVWRDRVKEFGDLQPGETIYITDVRASGSSLSLTPRSILAIREKPTPESLEKIGERRVQGLVVKVLDMVKTQSGAIYISTDGNRIIGIYSPKSLEVAPGEYILVKEALQEFRRGKIRLRCGEADLEKIGYSGEIKPPDVFIRLKEIASREKVDVADAIVEGVLYTKTQLITMRTRFGEAEKIGFWIKDEDAAVQGSAWRAKAREIAEIEEGSRIRVKWVSIRTNIFNEPEIQLDNESIIEIIERPGKDGSINLR
ncbi:MAG: OB-fold nucleic acid binding domain-containing protein [Aigarchaeota archaeon]|nr:OB-fold nucleic acid binding domain-containing protein [Aigarchaeota archaeon]MDW8021989.1 OB-fold nucleic acid binding domain-containing protein [Nitrososphaerota archaeon]